MPEDGDQPDADATVRAELAEAEAAEAEALAAAARARAKALRLRLVAAAGPDPEQAPVDGDEVPVTVEQPDAEEDPGPAEPTRVLGLLARGAIAAITVLIIGALLTLTGLMAVQHRKATRNTERAAEFEAAARQGVINMTSMDYHNAQADFERFLDSSTGGLRADLLHQTDDFISTLQQARVIIEGTVTGTAVESVAADSAVVLVAAKETVKNTASADQPPRSFRFSVTMARDGDQIKMEKVELVP